MPHADFAPRTTAAQPEAPASGALAQPDNRASTAQARTLQRALDTSPRQQAAVTQLMPRSNKDGQKKGKKVTGRGQQSNKRKAESETEDEAEIKTKKLKTTHTAPVTPSTQPDEFVYKQFGGGFGSNAGDSAVLYPSENSRRLHLIDHGKGLQTTRSNQLLSRFTAGTKDITDETSDYESDEEAIGKEKAQTNYRKIKNRKNKRTATLTHNHADHKGNLEKQHKDFRYINQGTSRIDVPNSRAMGKNDDTMFAWKHKNNEASVKGQAIRPQGLGNGKKQDPNAQSLGGRIDINQADGTSHHILTTGDMEPQYARESIAENVQGLKPMDIVKLAHHGSTNNLAYKGENLVPDEAIDLNTKILISGYTGTAVQGLVDFLDGQNERLNEGKDEEARQMLQVFMLFNNEKTNSNAKGGPAKITHAHQALQKEIGNAGYQKLQEANVTFGKEFMAQYPVNGGSPQYSYVGFDGGQNQVTNNQPPVNSQLPELDSSSDVEMKEPSVKKRASHSPRTGNQAPEKKRRVIRKDKNQPKPKTKPAPRSPKRKKASDDKKG